MSQPQVLFVRLQDGVRSPEKEPLIWCLLFEPQTPLARIGTRGRLTGVRSEAPLIILADGKACDKLGYELYFALFFFFVREHGRIGGLRLGPVNSHLDHTVKDCSLFYQ